VEKVLGLRQLTCWNRRMQERRKRKVLKVAIFHELALDASCGQSSRGKKDYLNASILGEETRTLADWGFSMERSEAL